MDSFFLLCTKASKSVKYFCTFETTTIIIQCDDTL